MFKKLVPSFHLHVSLVLTSLHHTVTALKDSGSSFSNIETSHF